MEGSLFIFLVSAAIVLILLGRAIFVVRAERKQRHRGAEPGTGYHIIHVDYSSGLSGHSTSYRIPRDPQAYARRFVPQSSKPKGRSE